MIVSYRVESIIALTGEHDQLFALLIRVPTHRMADAQMGHSTHGDATWSTGSICT
jgi:hypothetical protein